MHYDGTRIDEKSRVILSHLWQNGRSATTSEIKSETKLDDSDTIRYRFQKLEQANLLESELEEREGPIDVTRVEMTEECVDAVKNGKFGDLGDILIDFDQAEAQRRANMRRINELEEDIEYLKDRISDLEDIIAKNSCHFKQVIQELENCENIDATANEVHTEAMKIYQEAYAGDD